MAHSVVAVNRRGPPEYPSGRSAAFTHATDDYLRSPSDEATVQSFGNVFSWSVWVKFTAGGISSEFPRPMQLLNPLSNENTVTLLTNEFEQLSFSIRDTAGTNFKQYITPAEPLSVWNHYVFTWNGTTLLVYRNAVDITNTTVNKFVDGSGTRADDDTYWLFGAINTQRLAAKVYSPAVWNTVLTSAEVAAIHTNGSYSTYSEDFAGYVSSSSLVHYWDFRRIHDPLNDRAGTMNLFDSSITPDDTDIPPGEAPAAGLPVTAGLNLWLDASDSATITIDTGVSVWEDKSGSGNDATQSVGADQPVVNAAAQNGLDTLTFDGTSDFLDFVANKLDTADFSTFVVLNKPAVGSSLDQILMTANVSIMSRNGGDFWGVYGSSANYGPDTLTATYGQIAVIGEETVSPEIKFDMYTNGAFAASFIDDTFDDAFSITNAQVGDDGYGEFFAGNIGEIVMYDRKVSPAEQDQIEEYLRVKWGLPAEPAAFEPTDITGLTVWLDAQDESTIDLVSGDVQEWRDKSGNSNDATAATAGVRPLYVVGPLTNSPLAGKNAILFDGVDDSLDISSFLESSDWSTFIVMNKTAAGSGREAAFTDSNVALMARGASNFWGVYASDEYLTSTQLNQAFRTLAVIGTSAGGTAIDWDMYTDNVLFGAESDFEWNDSTFTQIGDNDFFGPLTGHIVEILHYNKAVSAGERSQIQAYLDFKYGF